MPEPAAPDHIGRVLGGRYRLVELLGTGSSARVYVAQDISLKRRVAVRLMNDELFADEAFRTWFLEQAQMAASWSHSHIMAVYDWSDEDSLYLVCEYFAGGTLRSMLTEGHLLSASQALMIGLEAARALEEVHRRGHVHLGLKPTNIGFDALGHMKLGDVGLASNQSGDLRYAAPEQANDGDVGERTDVYSLALVLMESVTGEAPAGPDVDPRTLDSRLGQLGPVLERALRPDPVTRPDIGELSIGLFAAAETMPRPTPLPLPEQPPAEPLLPESSLTLQQPIPVPPSVPILDADASDNGADAGSVADAEPGSFPTTTETVAPLVVDSPHAQSSTAEDAPALSTSGRRHFRFLPRRRDSTSIAPRRPPRVFRPERQPKLLRRNVMIVEGAPVLSPRRLLWVLTVLLLVGGAGFGGYTAWAGGFDEDSWRVPDLVGSDATELERLENDYDWVVQQRMQRRDGTRQGEVLASSPAAGRSLARGDRLYVWVSLGPELVDIPANLVGLPLPDARGRLGEVGLAVGEVTYRYDNTIPEGGVVEVNEVFFGLQQGAEVDLVLSQGREPPVIPRDLQGLAFEEVEMILTDLSLQVVEGALYDDLLPADTVIGVDPPPGTTVPPNSTVTLIRSLGPEQVQVPEVIGLTLEEATEKLEEARLCVGEVERADETEDSRVLITDPIQGTLLDPGTCVRVLMSTV